MNYLYLPEGFQGNVQRIKDGLLPVSPLIYGKMSNQQIRRGAYNICNTPYIA